MSNRKVESIITIVNSSKHELLKCKIGKLVRKTLLIILSENLISEIEVKKLQDYDYSKNALGINYPILMKIDIHKTILQNRTINDHTRYYSKPSNYKNEDYLITSEWFERSLENYITWLRTRVHF